STSVQVRDLPCNVGSTLLMKRRSSSLNAAVLPGGAGKGLRGMVVVSSQRSTPVCPQAELHDARDRLFPVGQRQRPAPESFGVRGFVVLGVEQCRQEGIH